MRPRCRHCGPRTGNVASRRRGLCWRCSLSPDVRRLYPLAPGLACAGCGARLRPRLVGGRCGACLDGLRPLPPADPGPTRHRPGTEEYLAVLSARALLRRPLFHHLDLWQAPGGEDD